MEKLVDATMTDARVPMSPSSLVGAPLAVGELLGGRYRIRRFVAAGGMGEVYEADDQLLGDPVAIKLLRRDLLRKPGAQARFADEIRLARRITHPNVCRVFDVGVDGDRVFYTMELHAGCTLKTLATERAPLSTTELAPLVRQMLAGIGAAHAAEIVHADLKPSNVLVDAHDRVIVTDFGLAMPCCATLACTCDIPHLVGTPAYMAPEQVTGGTVYGSTDLFSLGVILFELVTGELPWHGATPIEMANARLTGPTPSPRTRRPDLDAAWADVIERSLQRDRHARPQTTAEIAAALRV